MSKRFRGPVPFRASVASPTCAERDPYSKLDKLDQLVLNRNQLSGSIPVELGDMDWGRMAIVDTKPFKLRVILRRIFVERPQVTGIPAWPGGAACYRRSRYIL